MKDILLRSDDSINEEGINEYIATYGIDTPYNDPTSPYSNQTLLFVAVSSKEINPDIKLKLVSYLISKGADIKNVDQANNGLLGIALNDQNLELANLLLQAGANLQNTFNNKNLIDIALDLKNEQVLLWVLKNAAFLFMRLKTHEFDAYHKMIATIFPNYAKSELYQHLNKIAEEKILSKFDRLGLINIDEAALILAAKEDEKKLKNSSYENSIFAITDDDIAELIEQIKNLIENDTNQNVIKFQIVHFPKTHAIFGEFEIDKTKNPPTVKYLHCDPLPPTTKYSEIITSDFRKKISPLANIEIYDSDVTIQKGLGCSYLSIDGGMMLATPPDRHYVPNVFEYMKKHGEEKKHSFEEKILNIYNLPHYQPDSSGGYNLLMMVQEVLVILEDLTH